MTSSPQSRIPSPSNRRLEAAATTRSTAAAAAPDEIRWFPLTEERRLRYGLPVYDAARCGLELRLARLPHANGSKFDALVLSGAALSSARREIAQLGFTPYRLSGRQELGGSGHREAALMVMPIGRMKESSLLQAGLACLIASNGGMSTAAAIDAQMRFKALLKGAVAAASLPPNPKA